MPWIKIFISHSTKTVEAEKFLDAVELALREDACFDVRLDRGGLQGGDDWRAKLYEWMDEVHGAVLLLTAEALDSKFVQLEAGVLSWRRFRQPKFVLLPVLVGGVGVEDLSKGLFGEMELNRIQAVSLDDPAALAREVVRLLQVLKDEQVYRPRTAKEALEDRAANLLRGGGVTEKDLREVGREALGWTNEDFEDGTDYFEKFARELLRADIVTACRAIKMLAVGEMSGAKKLLDLVAPCWVEEEDAKPIAKLALSDLSRRALSLTTKEAWTLHTYIGRSFYTSLDVEYPVCPLVMPRYEDTLADFREQILGYFKPGHRLAAAASPEVIKRQIRKRNDKPEPVFVVFPVGFVPDAKILDPLREEFDTVTFVVLAGEVPAEKLNVIADKVTQLKPVDPGREQDAYDEYMLVYADLDRIA